MKIGFRPLLIAAMLTGSVAQADTIVLKSGKKIEGQVISEDAKSYLVEIMVTKTIKDEQRIAKNLVEEIIRKTEDTKELAEITPLTPTPDLLPQANYEKRITKVKAFITKFPQSTHLEKARKILSTLQAEHKVVASGGIKLDGQVIPASALKANAYDISARILFNDISRLATAKHYRKALLKWELLEKDYKNSAAYQKALPLIKKSLRSYSAQLKQLVDTLDIRTAKRETALQSMNENDRERTMALLAENRKKHAILMEKEKSELQLKWLTVDPYIKESLNHNLQAATTTLNNLPKVNSPEIKQAGPAYRATWSALAKGQLEVANRNLQELLQFRIPKRYTDPLEKQLKEKQETQRIAAERMKAEAEAEKARQAKLAKETAEKAAKNKDKKEPAKP